MLSDGLKRKLAGKVLEPPPATWKRRPEVLLQCNVPQPLHGMAPRTVLGSNWWNETRQACYRSTDYHCQACGVAKHLAAGRPLLDCHEEYEIDWVKGRMKYIGCVPLCQRCHAYIHDGRLRALMEKGEITQQHYCTVIQHGERVLREAGLKRLNQDDREEAIELSLGGKPICPWEKWRLVIGRKTFPPKFKTREEWEAYHA
jgi:hypothetical protein